MADYDGMHPPKTATDPKSLGADKAYPTHLFKWNPQAGESGASPNLFIVALDEDAHARAVRAGWSVAHLHTAPDVPDEAQDDTLRKPGRPRKD